VKHNLVISETSKKKAPIPLGCAWCSCGWDTKITYLHVIKEKAADHLLGVGVLDEGA
jgi:hypothetical protein